MARHVLGPRRSGSVESYLRETRAAALIAVLALLAAIASDALEGKFWEHHALLAGVVSSVIVVMLSVAVVNEALEHRRRRRWSVLAQYVMLQLVRNARMIWTGIGELAGVMPPGPRTAESVEASAQVVRDTSHMTKAVSELVTDPDRRRLLHEDIGRAATESDEMLGRWAPVMLNADVYAELIDRHVELASQISWLEGLLDNADPATINERRQSHSRSHPAVQIEGGIEDQRLAHRVVAIAQLAEELDRLTLEIALRIVPVEWWEERLRTTPPWASDAEVQSAEATGGQLGSAPARAGQGAGSGATRHSR